MKKNTLGLLAGVCLLLTGCGGTSFVNETNESKSDYSKAIKETLSLKGFKDGSGDFSLVKKSNEEYADGKFGIGSLGAVNGAVKVSETIKYTGTWTVNDFGVYELKYYTVSVKCSVSGKGAEDYISKYLAGRYLGLSEEAINAIKEDGKYIDKMTTYDEYLEQK